MRPSEIITQAAALGVEVELNPAGDGLTLWSDADPPTDLVELLKGAKPEIVAHLRVRQEFESHVANVMKVRDLPRPEAERAAFGIVLTEFLNRSHPDTPPDRCAWCGQSDDLKPLGWGERHSWVHDPCWKPWIEQRQIQAEQELASMGIVRPPPEGNLTAPIVVEPDMTPTDPVELLETAQPEIVANLRSERNRIDNRIRARIIDWDRGFCLHCKKPVIAWQLWVDVANDEATATARFHRDCLDQWIAAIAKGTNQ